MGKPRVIVLTKLKTFIECKLRSRKGQEYLPKKIQGSPIQIEPECIFEEEKPWFIFWRNPRRMLLHIKGELKPLKLDSSRRELDLGFLTMDDILKAVKAEIVRSLTQIRIIRMEFFLIIVIVQIITIGVMFYGFSRMGVFQ